MKITINANSISKKFSGKTLFRDISISMEADTRLCIKGPNGSGKSTLVKILSNQMKPTTGSVVYMSSTGEIGQDKIKYHTGVLGPHISPYEELTCAENINFVLRKRMNDDEIDTYLKDFGLLAHKNIVVRHFSTGLKQRLKYILSITNEPPVIFLDEPGSNLDIRGKEFLYNHMLAYSKNRIMVIATNDPEEERLCNRVVTLA